MTSVFLIDWKLKFCLRIFIFRHFGAKIWVQVGSKIVKKTIFIPATSVPIQFFLLESPNKLNQLRDELTGIHKTLQKLSFYWNWIQANEKRKMPSESLIMIHENCRARLQWKWKVLVENLTNICPRW